MRNETFIALVFLLNIGCPIAFAQQSAAAPAGSVQKSKPQKAQKPEKAPEPTPARAGKAEQVKVEPISVKLGRGGKVAVSSRSGRIVVSGWDRDIVQASATGENGAVPLATETSGETSRPRLLVSTPAHRFGRETRIDLKVPRY